jgi:hypothetical protein
MPVNNMTKKCKFISKGSNSNEKIEILNLNDGNNLKDNDHIEIVNVMPKENRVTNEYQSINIKNNTSTPIIKKTSTQVKEEHNYCRLLYDHITVEHSEVEDGADKVLQSTRLRLPSVNKTSKLKGNLNE